MRRDEARINSFLRFGYFCDFEGGVAPIDFSKIDKARYSLLSRENLIGIGIRKLRRTIRGLWNDDCRHVVPLSGGLDSRLILGALLEVSPANRLHTYTYGVPGTYDFEIGNALAKEVGTNHTPIDLNQFKYSFDDEFAAARRMGSQTVLFYHPPLEVLDREYPGFKVWSGYVGDAVAGSYLQPNPSSSIREAKLNHLRGRVLVRSMNLNNCKDEVFLQYMKNDFTSPELLTFDEQVLFSEAAEKFTAPIILYSGFDYVLPLINSPWMNFMLSVPNKFRLSQNLMIDIGRRAFPKLFEYPSRNRVGHRFSTPDIFVKSTFWVNRVRKLAHQFLPWINWPNFQCKDFSEQIRSNYQFRHLILESVNDLRQRQVCEWIDFDRIWRRHDWRVCNHGDALIVLASLEIVLKASEKGPSA